MPAIHENFKRHAPPSWLRSTVQRLVDSLPPGHVVTLESIVLTDSDGIGKGKTHRVGNRKYLRSECLGFYHPASKTQGAWIELVVDNILSPRVPQVLLSLQFVRDWRVAKTLYHEIGHHLDATIGSAARGGELTAEDWRRRLWRIHFRRRYRYLKPFLLVLREIVRVLRSLKRARDHRFR